MNLPSLITATHHLSGKLCRASGAFCCLFVLLASAAFGQNAPTFTFINTVPKSTGFTCRIASDKETNIIVAPVAAGSEDAAGNGYSTGTIPWSPADGKLVVEVPGTAPVELKKLPEDEGSPIIFLRQSSPGRIQFSSLPSAAGRDAPFYDAVNLTAQPELEVNVDGKKVRLPQGKRVRLSKNKTLTYEVTGGPKDVLESVADPSHVMIFFGDDRGKVRCMVVADHAP